MGCHALLQGIFPTQGSNLPALAGGFFTTGATWEAHTHIYTCCVCVCGHAVYLKLLCFSFNYTSIVKKRYKIANFLTLSDHRGLHNVEQ